MDPETLSMPSLFDTHGGGGMYGRATVEQKTAFLTGVDNLSACRWGERAKSILSEDMIPGKYLLSDPILESYDISSAVDESIYVGTGPTRAVYLPLLAP